MWLVLVFMLWFGVQAAHGGKRAKITKCSGSGCSAKCTEDGGLDWKGCDHCDLWFCPKKACQGCLLAHQQYCEAGGDEF